MKGISRLRPNGILILLATAACLSAMAQPAPPPSLYAVVNNTQVWTINATNAQVLQTNTISGVPGPTWSFEGLTWSTRDTVLYTLLFNIPGSGSSGDIYLAHLDPANWTLQTNKLVGSYTFSPSSGNYFEGLAFVDSLQQLAVSHRSGSHGDSTDDVCILSNNGDFTVSANNGQDSDYYSYDSRRDLLFMVDTGNASISSSNMFAKISLTNSAVQAFKYFKTNLAAITYHRGLDAFFVSYATNGTPALYSWTTDGIHPSVTETFIGFINGLNPSLTIAALAPVPQPPMVSLKSPIALTQTVCIARSFPLAAAVVQGSAPVKVVNYYDGGSLIASSTNGTSFLTNCMLAPGLHHLAAQTFDGYLNATSEVQTLILAPPGTNLMAAQLAPEAGGVVCCLGGTISNNLYVIQSATNLTNGATAWVPFSTNRAVSDLLVITNAPLDKARFFRAVLP